VGEIDLTIGKGQVEYLAKVTSSFYLILVNPRVDGSLYRVGKRDRAVDPRLLPGIHQIIRIVLVRPLCACRVHLWVRDSAWRYSYSKTPRSS